MLATGSTEIDGAVAPLAKEGSMLDRVIDNATGEIRSLTGIRGASAVCIVIVHACLTFGLAIGGGPLVDLFFGLSGFVIAYVYLPRFARGETWRGFARARFARLYPLYFATALAFLAIRLAEASVAGSPPKDVNPTQIFQEMALVTALPVIGTGIVWNIPAWSVVMEWWINFTLFPLIVLLGSRAAIRPLVVVSGISLVAWAGFLIYADSRGFELQTGWIGYGRAWFAFGAGWVVYRAWRETSWRLPARHGRWLSWASLALTFSPYLTGWASEWLAVPLFPIVIFFLLTQKSAICSFLSSRALVFLGDISYSIYLMHIMVIRAMQALFHLAHFENRLLFVFNVVVVTLIVSVVTYSFIEKPARKLVRGR
ncbi:acyltransferase family protein [Novosphingobium album (ex Liu et al. 2023)]|uniref:Acyltransferase n=1 Tax=Novosphingobium album (ex Liu et al. 2023) TaxID=3031130 RepID=A0ABT5WT08_9SPHN|nr:acyltransferase [Novosphingobium album (ex Liu et al. 2023)]MDE8653180.1 acyltransferase [Novosphingobium album (ex Liu et al. 2023)]